ncbi:hypothetical protein BJ322DRAFT_448632 [Thelephora terrestris]|uniref:Fungal-type protein kinase domain-containing protein n=1 Tax=Thelephora terrestris TaxID=56493 RepID=A0A9P6H4A3_9AGAM|nr:hypothetical protein BJ322DRAFT_448632 [Thelephora terrestris]
MDDTVTIFLHGDPLYGRASLTGRSTIMVATKGDGQDRNLDSGGTKEAKSPPLEGTRVSKTGFVDGAGEAEIKNTLAEDHLIPKVLEDKNPPHSTSLYTPIRHFNCLYVNGTRVLRVITLHHPGEIKHLDEETCFFCHSGAPWDVGIERKEASGGNLAYDPVIKEEVHKELASIRLGRQKGKPGVSYDIGSVPFMALDIFDNFWYKRKAPHVYRYDAESFSWCLIFICICMGKDDQGRIHMIRPNPLSSWLRGVDSCHSSKETEWDIQTLLEDVPLHSSAKHVASMSCSHWASRFGDKPYYSISAETDDPAEIEDKNFLERFLSEPCFRGPLVEKIHEEPSDRRSFKLAFQLLLDASDWVPKSKREDFMEMMRCVLHRHKFVVSPNPLP